MSDYHDIDWLLLARYFSGESPEARRDVESWVEGDPLRKEYIESLRTVWEAAGKKPSEWDVGAAWNSLAARSDLLSPPSDIQHKTLGSPRHSRDRLEVLRRFAVAAALLVGIPYITFKVLSNHDQPKHATLREVVTERGERARIRLTDGSTVLLNSASSIRFPEQFADNVRELFLRGEAYFDINPMDGKLFIVRAQDASVEVIGTEFSVRAWPDEAGVQVVVAEGSVAFRSTASSKNQQIVLTKGEMSDQNEDGSLSPPQPVDLSRYLDWVSGRLQFDNSTLGEVFRRLERLHNIRCSVSDSILLQRRLTASFKNEPPDEIMRIIALTLSLRYSKQGTSVFFFSNRKIATP